MKIKFALPNLFPPDDIIGILPQTKHYFNHSPKDNCCSGSKAMQGVKNILPVTAAAAYIQADIETILIKYLFKGQIKPENGIASMRLLNHINSEQQYSILFCRLHKPQKNRYGNYVLRLSLRTSAAAYSARSPSVVSSSLGTATGLPAPSMAT